jgi:inorganic pyrophosphatase/exopolyphosphatase
MMKKRKTDNNNNTAEKINEIDFKTFSNRMKLYPVVA